MMAGCVILGVVIGTFYAKRAVGNRLQIAGEGPSRINSLLKVINDQYVDDVDINDLVERSMPNIIAELDPHSVYISAKDVQSATDDLRGSFSGVGIEFVIRKDTVRIQNVISDGPAEQAGLIAGDKIVSIDGEPFVGEIVTNDEAMRRLKGPWGTVVKIGILRYGSNKPKEYEVTRDDIVVNSINTSYMLDNTTGYMRIKNFGENTYQEMLRELSILSNKGMENLVIDLRDNSGGYMDSAIQMVNEFLPSDRMIVYTEGRKSPRKDYTSTGSGHFKTLPLIVLINEMSASAAEIFAGAIQDNDRGTIIGRRSFGKGLVQQQIPFSDGSLLRLTIARYYTPSGRCIQKPYKPGRGLEYEEDLILRYQHGEYFSQDSIKNEGPAYKTSIGREVYGGGGITPDIFIGEDTTSMTSYYSEAAMRGLFYQYSYDYTDNNRNTLTKFKTYQELIRYLKSQNLVERFAQYGEANGLKRRNLMIEQSHRLIERFIVSRIIYNIFDEQAWMEYLNSDDPTILKALEIFKKKLWNPVKNAQDAQNKDKVANIGKDHVLPPGISRKDRNCLLVRLT